MLVCVGVVQSAGLLSVSFWRPQLRTTMKIACHHGFSRRVEAPTDTAIVDVVCNMKQNAFFYQETWIAMPGTIQGDLLGRMRHAGGVKVAM